MGCQADSWTGIHQQGPKQKVNSKNFAKGLDKELHPVLERSTVLGSDDNALEPRTVSGQGGILETGAGLSYR